MHEIEYVSPIEYTPPLQSLSLFYRRWVGVGWQRQRCKTCRSLLELDNQGAALFCFLAVAHS